MAGDHTADDFQQLGEQLRAAISRKGEALVPGMAKVFKRDAQRWKSAMVKRLRGPLSLGGKSPDDRLATRSGALHRSLFGRVLGRTMDDLVLIKGSTSRYAVTHELGTKGAGGKLPDIVPKRVKWLTIPNPRKALTPSGVPRRAGARQWDLRFVLGKDKEKAYLIEPGTRDLRDAIYFLRKRSAIPPRMGMVSTHVRHAEKRRRDIAKAIAEVLAA